LPYIKPSIQISLLSVTYSKAEWINHWVGFSLNTAGLMDFDSVDKYEINTPLYVDMYIPCLSSKTNTIN